jgi:hypothetical protein
MSLKLTMTDSSFELHEADEWLPALLVSIEEYEGQYDGAALKWIFQLDGEDRDEWQFSSQKLSPKSKTYRWLKGLDPTNLPDTGQVVDFAKYFNTRVEVMYERYDDDGVENERIGKVRAEKTQAPIKGQQKRAAAAKTVQDDDEAPF